MSNEENIRHLNELFAEELEAGIRYLHLAVTVKGLDRLVVQQTLLKGMQETFDHAQTIAERIMQMGGVPSVDLKLSVPAQKMSGAEAIRTAIAFEQAALDSYRELCDKIKDDVALEEFVRAQVGVESQHVAELSLLVEE